MYAVLLNTAYVRGGGSLFALLDREFDAVTFHQAAESSAFDRGEMYKDIVSVFASNETVALLVVKPLYCADFAFIHFLKLSYYYKMLEIWMISRLPYQ